jgi:peptide deformylase
MTHIPLIYAPNEIFRKKAEIVATIDDSIRSLVDAMFETLYAAHGIGLGANMVGILKRIAIVDLQENNIHHPLTFINPEIIWRSEETQAFMEGSLSFPGIEASITRSKVIKLNFINYNGQPQTIEAEGFLATVIQHEIDYLDGKIFLDYISKLKRDTLLRKMQKHIKMYPPHIHTENCSH